MWIVSPAFRFCNPSAHGSGFSVRERNGGRTQPGSPCQLACKGYLYRRGMRTSMTAAAEGSGNSTVKSSKCRESKAGRAFESISDDMEYFPRTDLGNLVGGDTALLLYKPYMDHLWRTLLERTPDLHCLPLDPDMRRQQSSKRVSGPRVFNWLFAGKRLRRIRMTYVDGGSAIQAFNGLIYPDFRYDVPLLGIDLLSFGTSKILCVIDFTPLSQDATYLHKYTHQLAPIRAEIAKHCGNMTTRFYDENQFFSKELIFFRSKLGPKEPILQAPNGLLFKAHAGYIDQYLQILEGAEANADPLQIAHIASRQGAYNKYSEERDPAVKLFNTYFGEEWTERFTKEFLFPHTTVL